MRYVVVVALVGCGTVDATREPAAPLVELTITRTGAAGSYVQSVEQPGIVCGSRCTAMFPSGSTVTLWEAVDHGGMFLGWSGPCSGIDDCTLVIDGAQSVSAAFTCTGSQQFDYKGKIETFTVPSCASSIVIDAYGAQGDGAGALGARIQGTFAAGPLAGQVLGVLVGAAGTVSSGEGGGGSFVFTNVNDPLPLIAAAGGGGAGSGCSGGPGSATQTPTLSTGGPGNGTGGSNGTGGMGGHNIRGASFVATGGGGAGWVSDGLPGSAGSFGSGGSAPRNGGRTGPFDDGFGGGGHGGGGGTVGGGGGGFNGGGGGNNRDQTWGCGGGGGSYNGGTDPIGFPGTREGNGQVTISWSESRSP